MFCNILPIFSHQYRSVTLRYVLSQPLCPLCSCIYSRISCRASESSITRLIGMFLFDFRKRWVLSQTNLNAFALKARNSLAFMPGGLTRAFSPFRKRVIALESSISKLWSREMSRHSLDNRSIRGVKSGVRVTGLGWVVCSTKPDPARPISGPSSSSVVETFLRF
jgi:hypothetical protein